MIVPFFLVLAACGQTPEAQPQPQEAPRPQHVAHYQAPRPKVQPRIDEKKPYMRVWYWPPSPVGDQNAAYYNSFQAPSEGGPRVVALKGTVIDDVNFPTNRSKVVDEVHQLERLVLWLNQNPRVTVELDGYADARGSKEHNKKLSLARANAVRQYLVGHGVASARITTAGHGTANPVKGGTGDESYWLSRRVTIKFRNAPWDEAPAQQKVPSSAPAKPAAPATTVAQAPKPGSDLPFYAKPLPPEVSTGRITPPPPAPAKN